MRTTTKAATMRLSKLARLQKEGKIYLDDAFQSNERWSEEQKREYMESVIAGRAVTSIILANIALIRESLLLAFGEDNEDYIFFKNLSDKGYEWITIDGNNRDRCLADFVNDGFGLTEKEYEGDNQFLPTFKAKKGSKLYTELSPDVRKFIDDVPMNVLQVKEADRVGLAELFSAVNKGMTLNAQEKRNAIMCVFGERVRELVNDENMMKGWKLLYTDKQINRRYPDEIIVTAAVIIASGMDNVGGASRDAAYTDSSKELEHFTGKVEPVMRQIVEDMVIPYGDSAINGSDHANGSFIDLIMLLNYMRSNSIVIDDYKAFYNWFIESQSERTSSSEILYKGKKGTNVRTYSGLLRSSSKAFLKIRLDKLIESLSEVPDGVITFRDKERTFDYKLRYMFWKRQDGICPLSKTWIEPRFVWDTTITHVDHNMPWSKGGETSLDNGQLVFATENLSKSDNVIEEVLEEI